MKNMKLIGHKTLIEDDIPGPWFNNIIINQAY